MSSPATAFFVGPVEEPDKYRLRRQIGGGGEAELWQADIALGTGREQVAVKVLKPEHEDRTAWRSRWSEQADLLRLIRHPGVVGVHSAFEGPRMHPAGQADTATSALYLVMNWVEGQDLRDWAPAHSGPSHRPAVFTCLTQIADVLDWLHSGKATPSARPVIHGDLSPANVIVNSDGQSVLVDFGLFRMARHVTSLPAGTRGYIAPEVSRNGEYSPASDRYAFGGLAYYLLTGEHPPATRDALSAGLGQVFGQPALLDHALRMFADDPAQRPPAGEWVRGLRLHASTTTLTSAGFAPLHPGGAVPGPPGPAAPAGRPGTPAGTGAPAAARPWWLAVAGAALALVLVAGGVAVAALTDDSETGNPTGSEGGAPTAADAGTTRTPAPDTPPTSAAGSPTPSASASAAPATSAADRPGATTVPLTSLESLQEAEFGQATIDGRAYQESLYSGCDINVEYNLNRQYTRFTSTVGLHDKSRTGSSATLTVYVDEVKKASVSVGLAQTRTIEADLTGGFRLRLEATDNGSGYCDARPAFANPVLVQ